MTPRTLATTALIALSIPYCACSTRTATERPAEESRAVAAGRSKELDQGRVFGVTETTGADVSTQTPRMRNLRPFVVTMESREGDEVRPTTLLPLGDDQIVEVLRTMHAGEIAAARLADVRADNAEVKRYALALVRQHAAEDGRLDSLAATRGFEPKSSPLCESIQERSVRVREGLSTTLGSDFDRQFVESELRANLELIDAIDAKLLPNAESADVRERVSASRINATRRLHQARDLARVLQPK